MGKNAKMQNLKRSLNQEHLLTRRKWPNNNDPERQRKGQAKERERDREFLSCKERTLKEAKRFEEERKKGEVGGGRTGTEACLNRQTVRPLPSFF